MKDHGDERPTDAAPERCTIGELSERVGMTVRNIRAYQARGLLPPPIVDGRVGFYTDAHHERLIMIRRLRAEGFNLVAISALLTGVVPVATPTGLSLGDQVRPRTDGTDLSDAGAALLAHGVPIEAVLALHSEVIEAVDQIAAAYGQMFEEQIRGPWVVAGSPASGRYAVTEAATALPRIAAAAVSSTLPAAMRRALQPAPAERPVDSRA